MYHQEHLFKTVYVKLTKRSANIKLQYDSRHGTGSWALRDRAMTVLTYRGKKYLQHKEVTPKVYVELSYRTNVYTSRQAEAMKQVHASLTYRGSKYQK